jgi:hypothetical protein
VACGYSVVLEQKKKPSTLVINERQLDAFVREMSVAI